MRLLNGFLAAALGGDLSALLNILAPDVVLLASCRRGRHVGDAETARARCPGVTDFLVSMVEFWPAGLGVEITQVNGGPGAVITTEGQPFLIFALDVDPDDQRLREINAVLNPDRFTALSR